MRMKAASFLISVGVSYLIGYFFGQGPIATYASILISYHVYLGMLILLSDRKAGFSLPVGSTILTHSACLAVLVSLAMGRQHIPFFGMIRLFIPALAPFEANWLFGGEKKNAAQISVQQAATSAPASTAKTVPVKATAQSLYAASTGDDFEEFLQHMKAGKRPFRKPGITVRQEYEAWLAARAKAQARAQISAERQTA
jgi:hypothetical protein